MLLFFVINFMAPSKAIRTRVQLEVGERLELKRAKQREYTQKARARAKQADINTIDAIEAMHCDNSLISESSVRTIQRYVKAIYDEFFICSQSICKHPCSTHL